MVLTIFFVSPQKQILKVLAVVVIGFYFSAATVAYTVLGLRTLEGSITTAEVSTAPKKAPAPTAPKDTISSEESS